MLQENIDTLLDLLEREQSLCDKLIQVSEDEQVSLVENDIDALNQRIRDMQSSVRELHGFHEHRRILLDALAGHFALSPGGLSLHELIDHVQGAAATELRSKVRELVRTGETLYRVNQHTLYLINFSLRLVDRQIEAWTDATTEKEGYGRDGRATRSAKDPAIIEEKV